MVRGDVGGGAREGKGEFQVTTGPQASPGFCVATSDVQVGFYAFLHPRRKAWGREASGRD